VFVWPYPVTEKFLESSRLVRFLSMPPD
jgi:hypothetical protein